MKILVNERLSEHKVKTPEGYLICMDAILARTGKQTYRKNEIFADSNDDSEIEVDRTADEVFSPQTLASFENKPVTVEHPDEDVNVHNHKDYAVGFVRDVRRGKVDGQDVMLGNLVITDEQTIKEIEAGEHTDLSCGYDCDIADEANPSQKNIRGNHVALCQQGRAGIARIVDSVNDIITDGELDNLTKLLRDRGDIHYSEKIVRYDHKRRIATAYDMEWDQYTEVNVDTGKRTFLRSGYKPDFDDSVQDATYFKTITYYRNKPKNKYLVKATSDVEAIRKVRAIEPDAENIMAFKESNTQQTEFEKHGKETRIDSVQDSLFLVSYVDRSDRAQYEEVEAKDCDEAIAKIKRMYRPYRVIGCRKLRDGLHDVDPRKGESKDEFISRFMKETKSEYPDEKQRFAVAYSYWDKKGKDSMKDDRLVELPIEDKKYFEQLLKKYGIRIDGQGKTWSGRTHYQVSVTNLKIREFVKVLQTIDALMDKRGISMTYSASQMDEQDSGYCTAGIDLDKKYVNDSVKDVKKEFMIFVNTKHGKSFLNTVKANSEKEAIAWYKKWFDEYSDKELIAKQVTDSVKDYKMRPIAELKEGDITTMIRSDTGKSEKWLISEIRKGVAGQTTLRLNGIDKKNQGSTRELMFSSDKIKLLVLDSIKDSKQHKAEKIVKAIQTAMKKDSVKDDAKINAIKQINLLLKNPEIAHENYEGIVYLTGKGAAKIAKIAQAAKLSHEDMEAIDPMLFGKGGGYYHIVDSMKDGGFLYKPLNWVDDEFNKKFKLVWSKPILHGAEYEFDSESTAKSALSFAKQYFAKYKCDKDFAFETNGFGTLSITKR